MTMRLVVVSAGLSVPSSTRLLADRLTESVNRSLAGAGRAADVEIVELRELAVPIANNLVTGFPPAPLAEAVEAVTAADGLIVVTPVFSASYSGLFKSFFDLIEPGALTGKPVLIGATGGTARHSLVLEHAMRPLFAYLRAEPVPTGVYAASEDWGGSGDPLTDTLPERIERAGGQLARAMTGGRPARPAPVADAAADEAPGLGLGGFDMAAALGAPRREPATAEPGGDGSGAGPAAAPAALPLN
ncbi:FMN reductase [Streptomyces sp. NPDC058953]|uniref:FMN reductase n=1 Tax=unclassified Streptomyces TaxID=2593676 RepID=UPI003693E9DA